MADYRFLPLSLRLFDGAGAGGAGGGAAAGGAAGPAGGAPVVAAAPTAAETSSPASSQRGGKAGELSKVVYGIQDAGEAQTGGGENADAQGSDAGGRQTPEERRARFRELIRGEYKDEYTAEFQDAFNRRFRDAKGQEALLQKQQPVLELLFDRYKIADGDVDALTAAISKDDALLEQAADEAGMTPAQYREFSRMQRENKAFKEAQRRAVSQQQAQEQMRTWYNDAEALKAQYPDFDLAAECKNPQFVGLLKAGIGVETAYKTLHMDDLVASAQRSAAASTERRVVEHIRAKGQRPAEVGASAAAGITVKQDVSKLTKDDRAEVVRRAMRGEQIRF